MHGNDAILDKKMFILEGNIGAGKSTFLKILKDKIDKTEVVFEPLNKWQDVDGQGNFLDLFYKDTKRWAYTFQSYAFVTRVQSQLEYQKNSFSDVLVFERSVYYDRYCFAKNCFESGFMTALEWQTYKEWFTWLVEGYTKKPDGFIYLNVSPEICYQRLLKRNRFEEVNVSLSYLKDLHKRHEDWLVNKIELMSYLQDVPVLILNCDKDFEKDLIEQNKHLDQINSFIYDSKNTNIKNMSSIIQV